MKLPFLDHMLRAQVASAPYGALPAPFASVRARQRAPWVSCAAAWRWRGRTPRARAVGRDSPLPPFHTHVVLDRRWRSCAEMELCLCENPKHVQLPASSTYKSHQRTVCSSRSFPGGLASQGTHLPVCVAPAPTPHASLNTPPSLSPRSKHSPINTHTRHVSQALLRTCASRCAIVMVHNTLLTPACARPRSHLPGVKSVGMPSNLAPSCIFDGSARS